MYANLVCGKISNISPIDTHELTREDIKCKLNERLESITSILISTAKEIGCVPLKTLKPKAYWYPELSELWDKKRFWWFLWVLDGRPRSGIVFDMLKDLKKKNRKISRNNITKMAIRDTNLINSEFKNKNLNVTKSLK